MSAYLACPKCGHLRNHVLDSRPNDKRDRIRRRRQCSKCHHRWTTAEGASEELEMSMVDISKLPPMVAHMLRALIEAMGHEDR